MNFLEANQKTEVRAYISKDIILNEPTKEQLQGIREVIEASNVQVDGNKAMVDYSVVRYIIRELCINGGFIDKYSDEELEEKLDNGKANIKKLFYEVIDLIEEVMEEIQMNQYQQVKNMNSVISLIIAEQDEVKLYEKLAKLLKKQGVKITTQQIIDNRNNPEELTKLIEQAKVNPKKKK